MKKTLWYAQGVIRMMRLEDFQYSVLMQIKAQRHHILLRVARIAHQHHVQLVGKKNDLYRSSTR